jgi:hypothetical protein
MDTAVVIARSGQEKEKITKDGGFHMTSRTFPTRSRVATLKAQSVYQVQGQTNGVGAFIFSGLERSSNPKSQDLSRLLPSTCQRKVDLFPWFLRVIQIEARDWISIRGE